MVRSHFWARVIAAMLLGLLVGFLLSPSGLALVDHELALSIGEWLKLPSNIFIRLIQMVIIPLIFCSIILGISASADPEEIKRIGLPVAVYFITTTAVAVSIGYLVATLIKPGEYIDANLVETLLAEVEVPVASLGSNLLTDLSLPNQLANLIPANPLKSGLEASMLDIVVYSLIIGVVLLYVSRRKAQPLIALCEAGQVVSMKIVSWAIELAPFAVFGLLCEITIKVGAKAILGLGVYIATVLLGLLLLLIFYLILVSLLGGIKATEFLNKIKSVQLLAFSTSSSAAVIPLSMQIAIDKLKLKENLSRFIIPVAATINMDGTALYQVVAVIFLSQVFGIELSIGSLILLMLTTIGASIGAPSSPGVGIAILATILQQIGIPAAGVVLIIGVDRILDMSRTAVNVSGDLTACAVMSKLSK